MLSSVGRASALHAECQRFEPVSTHQFLKQKSGGLKGRRFAFFEMPQGLGKLAVSDVGNAQSES